MIDNVNLIVDEYTNTNKTIKDVANDFGLSYSAVQRILKKLNIPIKANSTYHRKHITSPFKEEVKDIDKLKIMFNDCIPILEISKELGVGRRAVERKVKELGLIRPKSMMSRQQYNDKNDELIVKLYNEGKSPEKISKIIGTSRSGVKNHLIHCGVELRDISGALFKYNGKDFPDDLMAYESLYDIYVIQRLSKKDISETYNVSPNVINRLLKKFGIKIRDCSESKFGLLTGEKHPNWKGGVTTLYSKLRQFFKTRQTHTTLERDGYKCSMCGDDKNLQVHHIKYFKDIFNEILHENETLNIKDDEDKLFEIMSNDDRFNDLSNLITYCKECHLYKVHGYKKHENE